MKSLVHAPVFGPRDGLVLFSVLGADRELGVCCCSARGGAEVADGRAEDTARGWLGTRRSRWVFRAENSEGDEVSGGRWTLATLGMVVDRALYMQSSAVQWSVWTMSPLHSPLHSPPLHTLRLQRCPLSSDDPDPAARLVCRAYVDEATYSAASKTKTPHYIWQLGVGHCTASGFQCQI